MMGEIRQCGGRYRLIARNTSVLVILVGRGSNDGFD